MGGRSEIIKIKPIGSLLLLFTSCSSLTLRDAANGRLYMGSALSVAHFDQYNYTTIASQEYDLATAENECKWAAIEPDQGVFDFVPCDTIKNFTMEYNMGFRGHNLCWGSYNPSWLVNLNNEDKKTALINHIQHVVGHYGSDVVAWDVVNEAISDESSGVEWFYKQSDWYPSVPDFVPVAFTTAREACESCLLFYNDYDIASSSGWMKPKSDAVYAMVKQLLEEGVPIGGVGFQLHVTLDFSDFQGVRDNIQRLGLLGLQVHFTELDVACGVYPGYECPIWGSEQENQQASIYGTLLNICLEEAACTSFETWEFTDKYTWLTDFYNGTNEHPLPFDESYNKKPAYDSMLDILSST